MQCTCLAKDCFLIARFSSVVAQRVSCMRATHRQPVYFELATKFLLVNHSGIKRITEHTSSPRVGDCIGRLQRTVVFCQSGVHSCVVMHLQNTQFQTELKKCCIQFFSNARLVYFIKLLELACIPYTSQNAKPCYLSVFSCKTYI